LELYDVHVFTVFRPEEESIIVFGTVSAQSLMQPVSDEFPSESVDKQIFFPR
jgi:hypothetical protein